MIQRPRIVYCFDIFHRFAMNRVANGKFDKLAATSSRNAGHLSDYCWNMTWRCSNPNLILDAFPQFIVEQ